MIFFLFNYQIIKYMMKQAKRLNSPYTSIQEFNKTAAKEECYPISESPDLFTWKLTFQQLSRMEIPKPFAQRHKMTHAKKKEEIEIIPQKPKIMEQNQNFGTLSSKKQLPFIDMNQKKMFKMSKFKEFLLRQKKSVYNNRNHSLIKTMSSMPLNKLQQIFDDKQKGINNMITLQRTTSKSNRQFIQPKQNQSLIKPLGTFLAMVNATCSSQKKKENYKKVKSQTSGKMSIQENLQQENFQDQLIQVSDNESFQLPNKELPYRMKNPKELINIGKNQNQVIPINEFNGPSIQEAYQQSSLTTRLSQKFSDVGQQIKTDNLDDKNYFFNYNTYFRRNYGNLEQGLNARFSKKTSETLKEFEINLKNVIKQK